VLLPLLPGTFTCKHPRRCAHFSGAQKVIRCGMTLGYVRIRFIRAGEIKVPPMQSLQLTCYFCKRLGWLTDPDRPIWGFTPLWLLASLSPATVGAISVLVRLGLQSVIFFQRNGFPTHASGRHSANSNLLMANGDKMWQVMLLRMLWLVSSTPSADLHTVAWCFFMLLVLKSPQKKDMYITTKINV